MEERRYMTKCRWVNSGGVRCMQRGQYVGNLCKRHCLGEYEYRVEGIKEEGCGNIFSRKVRVDTIRSIEVYSENKFIGKNGVKYEYVSSANTYVIMKNIETDEEIIFWKDTESRGAKGGYLINMLTTVPFENYCEDIAVCRIEGEYYCKDCFENTFRGKIRSLMETVDEKNLGTT